MATVTNTLPLLVVAGSSGVGKGALLQRLFSLYPSTFAYSISYTTRAKREGETHGKEYYFVSRSEFEKCIKNNEFLEYTTTFGNYYGTTLAEVARIQKTGCICVLEVDLQGVSQMQTSQKKIQSFYVYLYPPNLQTLQKRLEHRNTENQHEVITRLEHSKKELELAKSMQFDCVLLNNDFEQCFSALQKNVQTFYAPHSSLLQRRDILGETYKKDAKPL
ncbi:uncharacterized protein LOC128883768 [Hylaeus volcanicus]|uniref:uncharacterized protein LOC128883768 n=1 Tax=Hylaeus volcanicus TaxID=313075 RepID=UPI0023B7800F|nr:uncharacterized protein LOC128883768 [Hylaeus volcanicus]